MKKSVLLFSTCMVLSCFYPAAPGFSQETPVPPPALPSVGAYETGLDLYRQKKFAEALPYFQRSAAENGDKALPLYYLACCEDRTGDWKDAALHFYQVDLIKPYPALRAQADKLKDKLGPEDQEWLEQQLRPRPSPTPGAFLPASGGLAPPGSRDLLNSGSAVFAGRFGLRTSVGMDFWGMGDLDAEGRSSSDFVQSQKAAHPRISLSTTSPGGGLFLEVNPFMALEDVEIGGKATYYFSNSYVYRVTDSDFPAYFDQDSVDFDSIGGAVSGRFSFKMDPASRFYIEPSVGIQTLHLNFNITYQGTSSTPSAASYGYSADGTSLRGGLLMGFDFKMGKHFLFSLAGGYNYSRFSNLRGTFHDGTFTARNNIPGQAVMERNPNTGDRYIWFKPDDPSKDYLFYGASSSKFDLEPMVVDLSAVRLALDMAVLF